MILIPNIYCKELPFIFDNIAFVNKMTGGEQEAHGLAAKMSQPWSDFTKREVPIMLTFWNDLHIIATIRFDTNG